MTTSIGGRAPHPPATATRRLGWGAALGAAAAGLYLGTLSRHYSSDSCLYAVQIESVDLAALVAPHHLLLHPLGLAWFAVWKVFGWTGGAMLPLQVLNGLAGGACVGLLYLHCTRLTPSRAAALAASFGFACSGALWLLSTEAEFVTVPVALELLVLGVILYGGVDAGSTPARLAAVGGAIGVCALAYASAAILLPVALLALWMRGGERGNRLRAAVVLLAGFGALVAIGVLVILAAHEPERAVRAVLRPGSGYGEPVAENLPRGIYALLRSLLMFPGLGMSDRTSIWLRSAGTGGRVGFAATYVAVAAITAAPLVLAAVRRMPSPTGRLLGVWTALHAAFAFFWVPSDVSFWLPVTAAWWLLVAALADRYRAGPRVVAGLAVVLLLVNGVGLILPQHRPLRADQGDPCAFVRVPR